LADALRKKGGDIKLFSMRSEVKKLFDICGLSKILDICSTEEEALLCWGEQVGIIEKRLLWSIKHHDGDC
ncbi:MAG: hypothetical protein H7A34_08030, partial [bacterium]|nr:hypothetical protein [bacterium]